jgi:hypothetical protein
MSRFGDAAFQWMRSQGLQSTSSSALWDGLQVYSPELTATSERRKTPRATCMRDLRKDRRFSVEAGVISLVVN